MVEAVLGLWITAIGTGSIVFIDSGDVDSHYSLFRCSKMLQKTQSTQQNQPKSFSRQSQSNQECFQLTEEVRVEGPTNNHSIWWCLWVPDLGSTLVLKIFISNYYYWVFFILSNSLWASKKDSMCRNAGSPKWLTQCLYEIPQRWST